MNEELVTVSNEHERKILELVSLSEQTSALLDILDIGILVLDDKQRIVRFSRSVGDMFALQSHDIGQRLSVVGLRFGFFDLLEIASKVIETNESQTFLGAYDGIQMKVIVAPNTGTQTSHEPVSAFVIVQRLDAAGASTT